MFSALSTHKLCQSLAVCSTLLTGKPSKWWMCKNKNLAAGIQGSFICGIKINCSNSANNPAVILFICTNCARKSHSVEVHRSEYGSLCICLCSSCRFHSNSQHWHGQKARLTARLVRLCRTKQWDALPWHQWHDVCHPSDVSLPFNDPVRGPSLYLLAFSPSGDVMRCCNI